jgi:hypothetical protein
MVNPHIVPSDISRKHHTHYDSGSIGFNRLLDVSLCFPVSCFGTPLADFTKPKLVFGRFHKQNHEWCAISLIAIHYPEFWHWLVRCFPRRWMWMGTLIPLHHWPLSVRFQTRLSVCAHFTVSILCWKSAMDFCPWHSSGAKRKWSNHFNHAITL